MKLKRLRLVAGIISVLLIGVFIAGWFMKGHVKPSVKPVKKVAGNDENVLMGMTIKIPGNEKNGYWELKVVKFAGLEQIGKMKTIEGDYLLDGKPIYHVSAKSGQVNWENRQLRFENQVVFTSNDKKKLSAQEFLWNPVQNKVFAENQVVLSAPGLVVTTHKLEADPQLDKVVFTGETKFVYDQVDTLKLGEKPHQLRGER
ncbi:MAG TPA: LPS export ABC transporter periplasmic protein LptC [Bacillota bacterium]|nr:LPS export ABC transporter periplasmic protein LptC [Bacillota bacterium]